MDWISSKRVVFYPLLERLVGVVGVQRGAQGLVHDVDHVKGPGVLVQLDVDLFVSDVRVPAIAVQQGVRLLQRSPGQQEAPLVLVVGDVRLDGRYVETPLRHRGEGEQQDKGEYGQQSSHLYGSSVVSSSSSRSRAFISQSR